MSESWQPACSMAMLQSRARLLEGIRSFFHDRGVLEVETPVLSHATTTDPHIESLQVTNVLNSKTKTACYLHTSPEFPMKRLLANGSGDIFQICKVFRQGESGRQHNPEFSMLEWYRTAMSYHDLMREIAELVDHVMTDTRFEPPPEFLCYRDVFRQHTGLDPFTASDRQFRECAYDNGVQTGSDLSGDDWLDLLMSHLVESRLGIGRMSFVYDYPASQASLAGTRSLRDETGEDIRVAERFELYINGMELANGFQELTDAQEQQSRFDKDMQRREQGGQSMPPCDENLIAALQNGLPECAGVALGLDRLLMIITGKDHISEVLAFPFDRC